MTTITKFFRLKLGKDRFLSMAFWVLMFLIVLKPNGAKAQTGTVTATVTPPSSVSFNANVTDVGSTGIIENISFQYQTTGGAWTTFTTVSANPTSLNSSGTISGSATVSTSGTYDVRLIGVDGDGGDVVINSGGTFPISSVVPATVTLTPPASQITGTLTYSVAGNVTDAGYGTVSEKGVCWSATNNPPTITDSKAAYSSGGLGSFTVTISALNTSTTYYYRTYAINEAGVAYNSSTASSFTSSNTAVKPLVSAISFSNIQTTQATFTASVTDWGGATVSDKGFIWREYSKGSCNLTGTPPNYDGKQSFGTGIGNISYDVTGLSANTHYNGRIYATNSVSTSYCAVPYDFWTLPTTPTASSPSTYSTTGFTATWTQQSCAGYFLDVATNNTFTQNLNTYQITSAATTTYAVSSLTENTTYYYRVRAYGSGSTSTVSPNSNTITFITPVSAPTISAVGTITSTSFVANWTSVSGATDYYIDVNTNSSFNGTTVLNNFSTSNATTLTVNSLSVGQTYYYRVRSYNGTQSSNSSTSSVTTSCSAPTSNAASNVTTTSFSANWSAPSSGTPTGYRLDVATNSSFTSMVSGYSDLAIGNVLTYSVTGLTAGTQYYYRVRAYNGGVSDNSGTQAINTLTSAPALSAATTHTESSFYVNWSSVTGANIYKVYVATDAAFTSLVIGYNPANVSNSYSTKLVSGLASGTLYYYRVTATNSDGVESGYQTAYSTYTLCAAPLATAATSITSSPYGFTANWDASYGADSYALDISTYEDFRTYVKQNELVSSGTSYSISNLSSSTTYFYRVRAYNSSGYSNYSNTIAVVPTPSLQASSLSFSNIASTTMKLTWVRGNGANCIVVAKDGSAPTAPSTGSSYSANANFAYGDQTASGSYVVYNGTSTTVDLTGLTSGHTYYFAVYEYNGTSTYSTYNLTSPASGSQATLAAPTTQSSDIVFTPGSNGTSATISFTKGNGAHSLVVMRQTDQGTITNPESLTTYTASQDWSNKGTQLGTSGYYAIFNNGGNSVTVSNLTPEATYWVQVFEYNGSNGNAMFNTNSATGNPSSGIVYKPSAPSSQSSLLTFSLVSTGSVRASWTRPSGSNQGDYCLVVAKQGSAPTAPTDNSTYTASSNFGQGSVTASGSYVVYNGTDNAVDISNLQPGTQYYFEVYEYNNTAHTRYNTSTASNLASVTTLKNAPTVQSHDLWFSGVASDRMYVHWTRGNGENCIVLASNEPITEYPVDGNVYGSSSDYSTAPSIGIAHVVFNGNANQSQLITQLSAGTLFYFKVFEYNNTGDKTKYLVSDATGNPASQATIKNAPSLQAGLSITPYATTADVTISLGDGAGRIVKISNSSTISLPTDGTSPTANSAYSGSGEQVVYNGVNGDNSQFTITGLSANTTYYLQAFEYNNSGAYTRYQTSGTFTTFKTTVAVPTTQAYNLTASLVSSNSLTLNWARGGGDNCLVVAYPGTVTNPVYSTVYSANPVYSNGSVVGTGYVVYKGTGTSVNITGLSTATTYKFKVFEYNVDGSNSVYNTSDATNNPLTVTTGKEAPTVQASNITCTTTDFTSLTFSWTNGNGDGRIVVINTSSTFTDPTDGDFVTANPVWNLSAPTQQVVFNATTGNAVTITNFAPGTTYYCRVYEYNNPASGSTKYNRTLSIASATTKFTVPVATAATNISSTGFTANWGLVANATEGYFLDVNEDISFLPPVIYDNHPTGGVGSYIVSRSGYMVPGTTYYYRVRAATLYATSANSNTITVTLLCDQPKSVVASNPTTDGFTLNWTKGAGVAPNSYDVEVSTNSGFTSSQIFHVLSGTSVNLTGLTANTLYYYRVFAINSVGAGPSSDVNSIYTFINAPIATAATGHTTTSFTANWTAGAGGTPSNYRLDVATDENFSNILTNFNDLLVGGTSYTVGTHPNELTPGVTYYYRLRALNGSAGYTSVNSNTISTQTSCDAPVATAASDITTTSFTANWNAASGASSYLLDVSADNFATFVGSYQNLSVNGTSYSVTVPTEGTTYSYRLRAVNSVNNNSAYSNTINVLTICDKPVVDPATLVTSSSFTANWHAGNGGAPASYLLDISTVSDCSSGYVYQGSLTGTSYAISGLTLGNTYYYRVRAVNATASSAYSDIASVVLTFSAPVADAASDITNSSFTANWHPVTGETPASYRLDVATIADFSSLVSGYSDLPVSGTSQAVTGLTAANTYYYRVRAYNGTYSSANSSSITVTLAGTITWTGATNQDWATASNWNPASVPTSINDVIIPAVTNSPIIGGTYSAYCYNLTIQPNTTLLQNGALTIGNNFTLASLATNDQTGAIVSNGTLTYNSANTTVQRMLTKTLQTFSIPVTSAIWGNTFPNPSPGKNYVYRWANDVPTPKWLLYTTSPTFEVGKGYAILYNSLAPSTLKANFTGTLNSGTITYSLDNNASGCFTSIGNPYPCVIDWTSSTGWTKSTNIENKLWFYVGSSYSYYSPNLPGTSPLISPCQGFLIHTSSDGASLSVNPDARVVPSQAVNFKKQNTYQNTLVLSANNGEFSDKMYFQFREDATSNYDVDYDGYKLISMNSEVPQFYSIQGTNKLVANTLPDFSTSQSQDITTGYYASSTGIYSLSASYIETFDKNVKIQLEDKVAGIFVDLRNNSEYSFSSDVTGFVEDRFVLHFSIDNSSTGLNTNTLAVDNDFEIYANRDLVYVDTKTNQLIKSNVQILNTLGQVIYSEKANLNGVTVFNPSNFVDGLYIVKVLTENNKEYTKKVYLQK